MKSAVEADLKQLEIAFALHRRISSVIDTREIAKEIGDRCGRSWIIPARRGTPPSMPTCSRASRRCGSRSSSRPLDPAPAHARLAPGREDPDLHRRAAGGAQPPGACDVPGLVAPLQPRAAVIHGDPISATTRCSRTGTSPPHQPARLRLHPHLPSPLRRRRGRSLQGAAARRRGPDRPRLRDWGFRNLTRDLVDILNIWARFIYGPLLEDRVRTVADGVKPSEYGRRQAFEVHRALKERGPVTVPREFVFMDRAAVGLGAVFLHLRSELNYHRLFEARSTASPSTTSPRASTRPWTRWACRNRSEGPRPQAGTGKRCGLALRPSTDAAPTDRFRPPLEPKTRTSTGICSKATGSAVARGLAAADCRGLGHALKPGQRAQDGVYRIMADITHATDSAAYRPEMDGPSHEATYRGFVTFVEIATGVVICWCCRSPSAACARPGSRPSSAWCSAASPGPSGARAPASAVARAAVVAALLALMLAFY